MTDAQWAVLEPLLCRASKRGPKHADLRAVVNGILYLTRAGCPWRYLPGEYGQWTRVWSQFRRWSRNDTWATVLAALHEQARAAMGRERRPSMLVIDSSLARGASQGGVTFHDRGGPYGATNGAKRVVAVDVTGLPVGAIVVPASTTESRATELLLEHLAELGLTDRLELVLVDRGTTANAARVMSGRFGFEVRRVFWPEKSSVFRPLPHAWRVEVAHGRIGRARRLAKSFENTTASAAGWLHAACVNLLLAALAPA
nr:IS5 family transposase [Planosporangium flavigriseum]